MGQERHQLVVTYKYFDADFGSSWFNDTWQATVDCKIVKGHLEWIKDKIKNKMIHKNRLDGEIIITSVVCDGETVYSRQVHTWV